MKKSLNKKTIKELKQVFPLNLTNYSTDFCHQTPFDLEKNYHFDQSSSLYATLLNIESSEECEIE